MKPKISLTFERPLHGLIQDAKKLRLINAIEFVPDAYLLSNPETASEPLTPVLENIISQLGIRYSFHLVSNSLLSADFPLAANPESYFTTIKKFSPFLISEHLTCARIGDLDLTGNLTTVYNDASLECGIENLINFRTKCGNLSPFLLEHIPQYFGVTSSTMHWEEFYLKLVEKADFYYLLDLHNIYCDEINNGHDVMNFLSKLPPDRVLEIHVAGGESRVDENSKMIRYDSHSYDVPERVFELLEFCKTRFTPRLINLEREARFVDLNHIWKDLERINKIWG